MKMKQPVRLLSQPAKKVDFRQVIDIAVIQRSAGLFSLFSQIRRERAKTPPSLVDAKLKNKKYNNINHLAFQEYPLDELPRPGAQAYGG